MADISFEGDYTTPSPRKEQKNSRITNFFVEYSFGLIKTPAQAAAAQLIVAVGLFVFAGYMFSKSGDTVVPTKTSQELIDATLPTGGRK